MAKLTVGKGISDYISKLTAMADNSTGMVKQCVYEGGAVVYDAFDSAIDSIPSTLISEVQRQGLHDGLGLAKMQDDGGYINTKVGFDGYNDDNRYKTAIHWKANSFVARRVCAGTSHQPAFDFVRKAINSCKHKAEDAMAKKCDELMEKAMK